MKAQMTARIIAIGSQSLRGPMIYVPELEGVVDEDTGVQIIRRGRPVEGKVAVPFAFKDPRNSDELKRGDGFIYFDAALRFDHGAKIPSGAELSLRALSFAFRHYTNGDAAATEALKQLLADAIALYLRQHSGSENPTVNFVK
jgi:hypothetical protein